MSLITFEGFHGTNFANVQSIKDNNFSASSSDEEWLGNGTYFFTEGVANDRDPHTAAKDWAEASAWDNNLKRYVYRRCCVLKTTILIDDDEHFLDLTTLEGMEVFNYYRHRFNAQIKKYGLTFKGGSKIFRDGELINQLRDRDGLRLDAVKSSFYIKFGIERRLKIDFRIPNCTVLAVYDATKNIDKNKIGITFQFTI